MNDKKYIILSDLYIDAKRTHMQDTIKDGYEIVPFLLMQGTTISVKDGDISPISFNALEKENYTSIYWLSSLKNLPDEKFIEITEENAKLLNIFDQMCTELKHSQKRISTLNDAIKDIESNELSFSNFYNHANLQAEIVKCEYIKREIEKLSLHLKTMEALKEKDHLTQKEDYELDYTM